MTGKANKRPSTPKTPITHLKWIDLDEIDEDA